MHVRAILKALFQRRPGAPVWCYIPFLLVAIFFGMLGVDDTGGWSLLQFGLFAGFCAIQMWRRTLFGWGILFMFSAAYAAFVLSSPESGNGEDYFIFSACGIVPAVILWIGRPWRTVPKAAEDSPLSLPPTA